MKTSNLILLDTNVLVYACDQSSSYYSVAKQMRNEGLKGTISLCITPQVLSEFFAVITDPRRVTQPCSQQMALQEIQVLPIP